MAVTPTPVFPQTIFNSCVSATSGSTTVAITNALTVFTAGTNGSKIDMFNISSSAAAACDVNILWQISSVTYLLGTVQATALAGATDNAPAIDVLRSANLPALSYDAFGNKIMYLASGTALMIQAVTLPATTKALYFSVQGAHF